MTLLEGWIVEARRRICVACPQAPACETVPGRWDAVMRQEISPCPRDLHPTRDDAVAARAWPVGVAPISGCCDPPA